MFLKRKLSKKELEIRAKDDPTSLGNLIVKEGLLEESTLEYYIRQMDEEGIVSLLGNYLVNHPNKPLTQEALDYLLVKQKKLRGFPLSNEDMMKTIKFATSTQLKTGKEFELFSRLLLRVAR